MPSFIICPNCGKEININKSKVIATGFIRYIICTECNGKFTRISDSYNFWIMIHKISINMLKTLVIILTVISIYNSINGDKSNLNYTIFQGFMLIGVLILLIVTILSLVINDYNCKRIIRKSQNGYLPVVNGNNFRKAIDYMDEDLFYATQNSKLDFDNSIIKNALILLPKANIIMTIPIFSNIEALQINNTYILSSKKSRCYAILAEYEINADDLTLYFKIIGKDPEINCCEQLDINTIENEYIVKAQKITRE